MIFVGVINLLNNICDIEEDKKGGCKILVILMGYKGVVILLVVLFVVVYIWVVGLVIIGVVSLWLFVVFLSVFKLV